MTATDELVHYEVRDRIAHVNIDNGKANALGPDVLAAIDAALTRAEEAGPEQIGALVISGQPGMFSGGFDLKVMRSSAEAAGRLVTDGGALYTRLYGSPVPVIGACTGHAVAGGILLLMGTDYRVGTRGAFQIGLIETQIGMVLPQWAIEFARERLSVRHLQQATVGARMYEPDGAVEAGFLDAVVAPDEVLDAAFAEARRWADLPRAAYHGQVLANRGDRLARLADTIAADRGRAFNIST
jgi:enoyl-CoA hydratase